MPDQLYVERGTFHVENGTVEIAPLIGAGEVELTARGATVADKALYLTVDQAMTLGNKLLDAAREVRKAAPIGAKGNE